MEFKKPYNQKGSGQQKPLNNYQQNNNAVSVQPPQSNQVQQQLRQINFEMSEIYFPAFILQLRYDVFPLRNRAGSNRANHYQSYNVQ